MPDKLEIYSLLFSDCFFSNIIFNMGGEFAFDAARIFGGYDKRLLGFAASLGFACATCVNYLCGVVLYNMFLKKQTVEVTNVQERYRKLQLITRNFAIPLSILIFIPLYGNLLTTIMGFMRVKLPLVILVSSLSKAAYYSALILLT